MSGSGEWTQGAGRPGRGVDLQGIDEASLDAVRVALDDLRREIRTRLPRGQAPASEIETVDWIDLFRRRHPTADGTTYELHWPWGKPLARFRLDYLFLRPNSPGWRILDARHLPDLRPKHSDHRAVLATLHLPTSP